MNSQSVWGQDPQATFSMWSFLCLLATCMHVLCELKFSALLLSIIENLYVWQKNTVEPPITDPPRSGHPPYSGHTPCYGLKLP